MNLILTNKQKYKRNEYKVRDTYLGNGENTSGERFRWQGRYQKQQHRQVTDSNKVWGDYGSNDQWGKCGSGKERGDERKWK